jgi:hypothetical protein
VTMELLMWNFRAGEVASGRIRIVQNRLATTASWLSQLATTASWLSQTDLPRNPNRPLAVDTAASVIEIAWGTPKRRNCQGATGDFRCKRAKPITGPKSL